MNGFLERSSPMPVQFSDPLSSMEQMPYKFERLGIRPSASSSLNHPTAWAAEFHPYLAGQPSLGVAADAEKQFGFGPTEMSAFQNMNASAERQIAAPRLGYSGILEARQSRLRDFPNVNFAKPGWNQFARPMYLPPQMSNDQKGKGRMVELDDKHWEKQFAQMDLEGAGHVTTEQVTEVQGSLNGFNRFVG